jgi:outer membrane protein assembly factor BamB
MFVGFLMRMAALAIVLLAFIVWWLTNRRISRTDRFSVFGAAIAAGAITTFLSHNTVIGPSVFFMAGPWLLTAWTIWLLVARRMSAGTRRLGLFAAILLVWGPFTLIRMEGLAGDGNAEMRWRWSRSGEDLFLADRVQSTAKTGELQTPDASGEAPRVQSGDWPGFRGPTYDGVVYGAKIKTDWSTAPPRLVWRQRVGPGWSSVAIVGDRLFTQEQRGEHEAVICVDAAMGREVWVHQDAARFSENLGGVGPRATPTFADGRIYALGATGILNCLDAATGELKWSHNISDDSGAKVPIWGFSSSPLVMNEMVIVFAGGESRQNLLAYRAESGDLVWTAPTGHDSYASAQPASVGGEDQILF